MYYYTHHIGDFNRDTARLTDAQAMTYLRLLWEYYDREKPLADDPEGLAFRLGSDVQTVTMVLRCFFQKDGETWRHKRCDEEIEAYHGKKSKAQKSADARWRNKDSQDANASKEHKTDTENMQESCDRNATAMRTHSERNEKTEKAMLTENREPRTIDIQRETTRKREEIPKSWRSELAEQVRTCRPEYERMNPMDIIACFTGREEQHCRATVERWTADHANALEPYQNPLASLRKNLEPPAEPKQSGGKFKQADKKPTVWELKEAKTAIESEKSELYSRYSLQYEDGQTRHPEKYERWKELKKKIRAIEKQIGEAVEI